MSGKVKGQVGKWSTRAARVFINLSRSQKPRLGRQQEKKHRPRRSASSVSPCLNTRYVTHRGDNKLRTTSCCPPWVASKASRLPHGRRKTAKASRWPSQIRSLTRQSALKIKVRRHPPWATTRRLFVVPIPILLYTPIYRSNQPGRPSNLCAAVGGLTIGG